MKRVAFLLFLCHMLVGSLSAQDRTADYYAYVKSHGIAPLTYLADKLRTHAVVAVGEDHWIKEHPDFLCSFLRKIANDTLTNVDILALEFGNESDQKIVNDFLKADTYREDLVLKILQHAPDNYGNPYLEYVRIFQTVWETNQQKSPKHKTQIILLDPKYVQASMDGEDFVYTGSRDDHMFSAIRGCIVKKQHVLFYAGAAHTQAQIRGVKYKERYYNFPSAGFLLKKCYPDDVFIVNLWGAYMGSGGYEKDEHGHWLQIDGGTIDRAFAMNGNQPVAFDMGGAFNSITIKQYYANPKRPGDWGGDVQAGSPYRPDNLMKDWIDGIVFVGPVSNFSGQTLHNIYDDAFLKIVEKRSKGKFKRADNVFEYLRKIHPILQ